ncbi:MAG: glycosyltransferase family 4 protein [Acidobacteria bacterium]|nr:glycosyltransferase family 4 protein [Acidobacteriota bacterium]
MCYPIYRILQPPVRPLSIALTLPAMLVRDGVQFFHSTFTPPPWAPKPYVFTVHCLSSLRHPEYFDPLTAMRLNALIKIGIRRARQIVCVSNTTREDVQEAFGVPLERMIVTYNGVGPEFTPPSDPAGARAQVDALGIRGEYILYLGKQQAHKNLARLIEAYHRVKPDAQLVLAGREQGAATGISEAVERLGLRDRVIRLGYVPSTARLPLYQCARFFAFPSLWEGFGIPVIEAMACGTPVLTSTATSLPEIAGDAAVIVDPLSIDSIAEGVARLDLNQSLRQQLRSKGLQRARQFTWENCARHTLEAYRRTA